MYINDLYIYIENSLMRKFILLVYNAINKNLEFILQIEAESYILVN